MEGVTDPHLKFPLCGLAPTLGKVASLTSPLSRAIRGVYLHFLEIEGGRIYRPTDVYLSILEGVEFDYAQGWRKTRQVDSADNQVKRALQSFLPYLFEVRQRAVE